MVDRVDSEQKRDDQATGLVNFLHLSLHGEQGRVLLTFFELC